MRIVIVYGAPCSGKSTYVKKHMKQSDVVYDYDAVSRAITFSDSRIYGDTLRQITANIRQAMITYAATAHGADTLWIISTYLSTDLKKVAAEHIHIKSTEAECLQRLRDHSDGRPYDTISTVIKDYHKNSKSNTGDQRYKTSQWARIRKHALERDHHECQVCRQQGLVGAGEVVHHIKPSDEYPELMYELDNLQTLCRMHHEEIHGRSPNDDLNKRFPERWD